MFDRQTGRGRHAGLPLPESGAKAQPFNFQGWFDSGRHLRLTCEYTSDAHIT